jgi:hypothetical protein
MSFRFLFMIRHCLMAAQDLISKAELQKKMKGYGHDPREQEAQGGVFYSGSIMQRHEI